MHPKVSIIILSWNRKDVLRACVNSVLEIDYTNYKIIVVDNASTDRSAHELPLSFPSVKFIRNKENLGYAGGNNAGIRYAVKKGTDYILLLNDDVIVDSDFLTELVKVAESDSRIGMVGPKTLCFEEPSKLYQSHGKGNFYLAIACGNLYEVSEPKEVHHIYGTALLVKGEVVTRVGLLDSKFFLYFEDLDWCYRTKKAGYRIVYVPSAKVYHKVSCSFSGRMNPVVLYYGTRNELLFARKHLNPVIFFPLWIPRFIFRLLKYSMKTRDTGIVKAILRGFLDFTRNKYDKAYARQNYLDT